MNLLSYLLLTPAFTLLLANTASEDKILGNWFASEMENATIEVYQNENGQIYGRISDCDKKEWVGKTILKKVSYDESKKEWKGEIYSLKRDMTINVTITTTNDERLKLVGKKMFIKKTFYWSKKN